MRKVELAVLTDGLHRIACDVQERLNHLMTVDADRRQARVVVAHELHVLGLLRFDELRDVLGDPMEIHFLDLRRASGAQDTVDERREPVRFVDDHARVGLELRVWKLALEQLRGAA